ncbi:protein O-mannosyl-transferase TMTC4 isoform X3 [Lates japonicus]|uniref:Protein O-mannosyl-transferase TMTC4 isoform X3 n=1 Tax=Lates japonicus TaxID=270547 RepID=A0AAD3QZR6_LATJO|nr:protein O-mannosyl-transferase TMTC4 isoform X3 [Lates japonicus]
MALSEVYWDHQIPLPKLAPVQAKVTVALVALLCFINSYDGEFVFDDSEAIVNNKDLKPTTPLNNIWTNDFWGSNLSSNSSHKSYRPLTVLTFRLNYLLAGGLHPVGFHVLNIILHAVISALMIDVFAILIGGLAYDEKDRILNHAPKTSLLAALFFAAHPVHTESGKDWVRLGGPDYAAAWMNLGIVQNSLQKFEEAEQSYWNAIRIRKKYPDCYYNLGRLYADQNRHVDALNAWRNATVLKPDHSLAWNNMVILLDNTGNLGQAELIGREALKLLPNDHTIMFSLANVLGKLQKYKESEGFFLHALRINPNAASCHGNLAVLYHRWGKLELAKKHYELSLKLDPEAPGTRDNYNMLRRKLDQLKRSTP